MAIARAVTNENWPIKYGHLENGLEDGSIIPPRVLFEAVRRPFFANSQAKLTIAEHQLAIQKKNMEEFQRLNLKGFTTAELEDFDVITKRKMKSRTLTNGILPIFHRKNWETTPPSRRQAFYTLNNLNPLPNGVSGDWHAGNDLVWNAIIPSLQIASKMIMGSSLLPWFDTLLYGRKDPVEKDRIRPVDGNKKNLRTLHPRERPPSGRRGLEQADARRNEDFQIMEQKYKLTFGFQKLGLFALDDSTFSNTYAATYPDPASTTIKVYLTYEYILALLRPDLTDNEQKALQWFIASVLVHEMAHATWASELFFRYPKSAWDAPELFYLDHPMAELGFAMEHATFGGIPQPFHQYSVNAEVDMSPCLGFWLHTVFPHWDYKVGGEPLLLKPELANDQVAFPIKASMYEDIQQEDFWELGVRKYGPKLLHARNMTMGVKWGRNTVGVARITHAVDHSFLSDTIEQLKLNSLNAMTLTPLERRSIDVGQNMINSAKLQEQFLSDSVNLERVTDGIKQIISQAKERGSEVADTSNLVPILMECFRKARMTCDLIAHALLEEEKLTDTSFPERKTNLLDWNRDARGWVRQIWQPADAGFPGAGAFFGNELLALEACRVQLTSVNEETAEVYGQASELVELQAAMARYQANNNEDESYEDFSRIASVEHISQLTYSCCRMMVAAFANQLPKEPRLTEVRKVVRELESFRDNFQQYYPPRPHEADGRYEVGPCPASWVKFMNEWLEVGDNIRFKLDVPDTP